MWLASALVARQQQASGVLAASEPPPDSLRRLAAGGGSAGNSSGVANGARRRFPRNSTFLLSRHFAAGSVSLTNVTIDETQALDFCGGGAVEGCNCCCADSLRGPGSFMDSVNACDAAFCESEFHSSNCSALYTSVTSDGVPIPLDDHPMATPQQTEPPPSGTSDGVPVPDGHLTTPPSLPKPSNTYPHHQPKIPTLFKFLPPNFFFARSARIIERKTSFKT